MRIIFSKYAELELDDIYDFLSQKSELAAVKTYNEILDEIDRLLIFPQMAPIEPLFEEEPEMFHSLVVNHHYKVIYFINEENIENTDIWDCRRDPQILKQETKKS